MSISTPPAGRRGSTADDFAAFEVFDAAAFVFWAPELALVCAEPPDVADPEALAGADVIVEPLALLDEAGAWVFEAFAFGVVVAFALSLVVAARNAATYVSSGEFESTVIILPGFGSARLTIKPPMFSTVGGHGHAAVKVAN